MTGTTLAILNAINRTPLGRIISAITKLTNWLTSTTPLVTTSQPNYLPSALDTTTAQSRSGRALSFDGTNDYVDTGVVVPSIHASSTVSVWVYTSNVSALECAAAVVSGTTSAHEQGLLLLNYPSAGQISARVNSLSATASGLLVANTWTMLTLTYNGTTVKLYVNGLLAASTAVAPPTAGTCRVIIGTNGTTISLSAQYFAGKLHDCRIYNRALTASEIAALYNATKQSGGDVAGTLYAADLAGMWPLEGNGLDMSGNGYNGTLTGPIEYLGADVPSSIYNELGYTLNGGTYYYAGATDLTLDIQGNALANPGPLAKRAQPKGAPCATFDGLNDYALSNVVANASAGTLCARIYVAAGANGVALGARGPGNDRIYLGGNATQLGAGVGELGYTTFHTGIPITTGEYHLAVTYDSGNAWLYLDGELVASSTYSTPPTTTYPIVLGMLNNAGTPNTAVACRLSDARLFNRALSAIEVASISVGNDIASGLLAHWPMNEKSGLTLFDSSGNGYHATATGMTSGELWAQTQDTYHAALMRGIRTGQGKRGYRSFDGGTQYFSRADDSKLNISGDVNAWWAVEVEISSTGAVRYFFDQYDSGLNQRGWALLVENVNNRAQIIISPDGTTTGIVILENTTALTANTRAFVFAYHDPVANQVGISINGGAFATASYSGGIHNSTSTVNVGVSKSSGAVANYHSGKVHVAATGLPSSQPSSWSAIRDAIYNSGSPLTYDQLTPTQLSDWGVQAWYDCDEWGPVLRDKHAGLDLTGTGYNADYPVPAPAGLIAAPTREYGTFRSDLAKSFIDTTSTSDTSCSAGEQLWACIFMRLPDIINDKGYLGKYSSSTEWLLYVSASQIAFTVIHTDATNSTRYIVTTPTGQWVLVFAYIDALTNAGQLSVGLGLNGESLSATSFVTKTPKNNTGDKVQIGNFFSGNNQPNADIAFAAIGKNPSSSFAAIRDLIYNSGTPLQYSDLSDAQKTAIGLVEWFEVGDYQGEEELIGKHASTVMTGSCIPSRTTQGGAGKLPPINTSIDFSGTTLSGGTAAPWTAQQYQGYLTGNASANGRVVTSLVTGQMTTNVFSLFFRVRNVGSNSAIFGGDNGANVSRRVVLIKSAKQVVCYSESVGGLAVTPSQALPTDDQWHEVLVVWENVTIKAYIDGVLVQTTAHPSSVSTGAWTRAAVLANEDTIANKFSGDISRLIVTNTTSTPNSILSQANLLDLTFDSEYFEDVQNRISRSLWLSGHTPAKLTVPTAYKFGTILPEGMRKTSDGENETNFQIITQDI